MVIVYDHDNDYSNELELELWFIVMVYDDNYTIVLATLINTYFLVSLKCFLYVSWSPCLIIAVHSRTAAKNSKSSGLKLLSVNAHSIVLFNSSSFLNKYSAIPFMIMVIVVVMVLIMVMFMIMAMGIIVVVIHNQYYTYDYTCAYDYSYIYSYG